MADDFDALFTSGGIAPVASPEPRPCILLVGHDASRTGAPLTLLYLAEALLKLNRFELRIVARDGGPLAPDFARVAPLCIGVEQCSRLGIGHADFTTKLASEFAASQPRGLAICNTVAIPEYNEAFMHAGVNVLTLVHELPAFFEAARMALIVRSSRHVGVYSEWNRAHFTGPYEIPDDKLVITPPVLPHLASTVTEPQERGAARRALGIPEDALMVLGSGYKHLIKGTDLFIQIAARCRRMLPPEHGRRLAFCWIGGDADPMTSQVLLNDIATLGLSGMISLPGPQADPWPWCRAADVFACTSRWEAMGLSVLEAMSSGLPVVTFSGTGASRYVVDGAGQVVPQLNIDAFARSIVRYLSDPASAIRTGRTGHQRVRQEFGDGTLPPGLLSIVDRL